MRYDYRKVAGALVFVGGSQFVVGMLVTEALYPVVQYFAELHQ